MARTKVKKKVEEDVLQLTQEAYDNLKAELDTRLNITRLEIANELNVARELGDLSENHAYQVAVEKRDFNENRIIELEGILAVAQIVQEDAIEDGIVGIGDSVTIQHIESGKTRDIKLVGSEDSMSADSLLGNISINSPIGAAILGAKQGDTVNVVLAKGKTAMYKILEIK
jgi:transcription elongation factor GreA